jgi:hypothetical protein
MSLVTIVFYDKEGSESYIQLPWCLGKRLRHYLRDPALRRYHLVGRRLKSKVYGKDRRSLGLTSTLEQDEIVHFIPTGRALS